ncbi:MAG: ABC transporter permease [Bryobacteraceae bacterium]
MPWQWWIHTVPLRLRSIFRRSQVESELDEELRFHLERRIEYEIAAGRTPEEARRAALRAMDGMEQRKEECRDMRHMNVIDNLIRDVRYTVRTLARSPGFTFAALLALALGIGANTAVFSVVNSILLRPLPYADSDRLVMLFDSFQQQGMDRGWACVADFLDWKERSRSFQTLDAVASSRFTLSGDGDAEQIVGMGVTSTFFETLLARPLLGRTFTAGEDQPGHALTVVLSERLWHRRYGSTPNVLGKEIALNGRPHTIIGVMPASFELGQRDVEAWAILVLDPPKRRGPFFLRGVARLKPGVTLDHAAAEMDLIAREVERANPKDYTRLRFPVVALRETVVGDIRPLLWVLSGAVLLVFLIAVSNVANLMLARATTRQREIAIRLSIGAGRGQLVRQFMTESLMLSLAGGAIGMVLAFWGVAALRWLEPRGLPRLGEIGIDARVLAFTVVASLASAVLFGLAPALAASGAVLSERLKESGRGGESQRHGRARGVLVIAQVTLSVLLLIGAGLLIRSFNLLGRVHPGFHAPPEQVLTMLLSPTGPRYRDTRALGAYWDRLLERVCLVPGVQAASVAITIPPDRVAFSDGYEIESKPTPPGSEHPAVPVPFVSRDYFRTLGIPLLRGRWFDGRDRADSPRVTVISEAMARRHFPGENPVGQRLKHGHRSLANPYMEIIGVVGDVKYQGLDSENTLVYYELTSQVPSRPMWLLVRTRGDAQALAPAVRQEIRSLDPGVPIDRVGTMSQALSESVSLPRFRSLLMTVFAATALLLAAIGIYGVIAYSVAQRTQEIGVRMALGATPAGVLRLVIGQGGRLAFVGIALGLAGAFGLTRVLEKMLFGVSASDTVTFASAALVLGAVAIVASLIPALRAARVDPLTALRHD